MQKRPFIIDCDTGTDDAIAIIAALYSDEVEVRAITSVNGNVEHKYVCQNNLDLMEYLGQDVPVAKGAVKAIRDMNLHSNDGTHGPTGLGTLTLPAAQHKQFDPRIAAQVIYETAVEEKGELELLVIGPMTNIAIALLQYPDLPGLIKHIWFMGGAAVGGNVNTTAEFNIWVDPEAAHVVLESGIPMTMAGLDVTLKAAMIEEDAAELRACGTRGADFVADLLEFMFRRRDNGHEDALMHDALALGAALCPECLVCKDCFVDVECFGQYTRGHTAVDLKGRSGKPANVSVALEIDVPRFRRWLVDTVKNSAKLGDK
ncbi:nucleoside hydrolase [Anaerofilum sp. BX8]|uniref:Nucleoside hydrolase n=1 Tax=Anaerofilum hominis TaxID=2763016 RepID=A0A923L273_9FIRM|nr:nucleoside hydrolase [Anaerofilum hominis]MBC5582477.1 nucleoside hydrolase [Anaerofilum hominis]